MTASDERVDENTTRIADDSELVDFLWQELNTDIGTALRRAREVRNLRQAEVAKRMGVQASRVSQIESAKGVSMTLDVLARYVAALGYRLDVDIRDPENDALVSTVPVVPMSFLQADEVEARSSVSEVQRQATV